jgi:hypothetical protein
MLRSAQLREAESLAKRLACGKRDLWFHAGLLWDLKPHVSYKRLALPRIRRQWELPVSVTEVKGGEECRALELGQLGLYVRHGPRDRNVLLINRSEINRKSEFRGTFLRSKTQFPIWITGLQE